MTTVRGRAAHWVEVSSPLFHKPVSAVRVLCGFLSLYFFVWPSVLQHLYGVSEDDMQESVSLTPCGSWGLNSGHPA